jgi:hypothetical protein
MFNPKDYLASFRRVHDEFARETAAARSAMAAAIESSQRLWRDVEAANARWLRDSETVIQVLPQRGWYLTGQEPCTLVHQLARFIEAADWEMVDRTLLDNMPRLLPEKAAQWLSEQNVPAYSVKRFQLFLDHHHAGRYEEATFIGIPLLDELSRHLYDGADFTTKRQSQNCTKPAMAMRRASGLGITSFASRFVSGFGSLQKDSLLDRCEDPDYWCRHAILHGQMRRPMGLKDSAKCYMALAFLIFAREQPGPNE